MEEKQILLDCDFVLTILEVKKLDAKDVFIRLMKDLNVFPIMHPYVAGRELENCKPAQELINEGVIEVIPYDAFLRNPAERRHYESQVWDIYQRFHSVNERPKNADIFSEKFTLAQSDMGEILTEVMAAWMQIPLFASNDEGAKRIAQMFINNAGYQLSVKNIGDIAGELAERPHHISWKEMKILLRDSRWGAVCDALREIWSEKTL